jgi:hypothetical protein
MKEAVMNKIRDQQLKKFYLEGGSRQAAMQRFGVTKNNSMSSWSSRLGLHWRWPLENRRSGKPPEHTKLPVQESRKLSSGHAAGTENRLKNATLKKKRPEVKVDETASRYREEANRGDKRKFGRSTHVLTAQRRERGLPDPEMHPRSSAFDIDDLPRDIIDAFEAEYAKLADK